MITAVDFEVPVLDQLAKSHLADGNPVTHQYQGWPHSHVVSTEPFEEQPYGTFINRAPRLSGRVAIAGFAPLNELWPGVIITPFDTPSQPTDELYLAGFTPDEYRLIAQRVLSH